MNQAQIKTCFKRLAKASPEPKGELNFVNNFTLLVAVVLSAQATDVGVNKATEKLFQKYYTPEKMAKLGKAGLIKHIKTIGLYRNKAKNVIALSKQLINTHKGIVPNDHNALVKLPGVGRKTANVVLNLAFGEPTIAVDTHIFRVSNRLGIAPGNNVDKVEEGLLEKTPATYKKNAHHWLLLHGRYVCKARKPNCENCILADLCQFKANAISNS